EVPPTLSEFLEEVALVADIDKLDDNGNHIVLMTLHSAKGLEFPYVYLSGMEDGVFPSYMTIISEDPQDIEEERRLAYVGITRAKEDLTLTCAKMRMIRGETQYNAVSRFVKEIPQSLLDGTVPSVKKKEFDDYDSSYMGKTSLYGGTMQKQNDFYQTNRQQTGYSGSYNMGYSKPASKADSTTGKGIASLSGIPGLSKGVSGLTKTATGVPQVGLAGTVRPGVSGAPQSSTPGGAPDYGVGDRVYHQKFGEGTVLQLEAGPRDCQVTVEFDTAGKRVMYAAFAKLQKRS
ncbi:MAG: 3'-5' exonuclease, partial [Lachnospiraceae bacterium]